MVPNTMRREPIGVSVLISGAGVGGLMTALECWRHGCDVRVFERTKISVTSGDTFNIGSTALKTLKHWPDMQKKNDEIAYEPMIAMHDLEGERVQGPMEFAEIFPKTIPNPPRIYRHSRPKLHAMLLEQLDKIGVEVEYEKEVVDYYEDAAKQCAGVILKDGSKHEADLVVAADGIRSKSWSLVAGKEVNARPSGMAIFRVAYPVELAIADPVVAERFKLLENGRSVMEMWNGAGMYCLFWRNQDQMCWSVTHQDRGTAEESWYNRVEPEEALRVTSTVPDWPDYANRVIQATPPGLLVNWKLMWRDPQPKWTSPAGYVIQLGDSAHTFLPSSGNGGTQAIEDAASLAACVAIAGKAGIPNATRVHNLLRFERCSCLQALGVANREARISKKTKRTGLVTGVSAGRWLVEHDPEEYAFDSYEKALASLTDGTPFRNTNIPPNLDYRPWTIGGLVSALETGEPTILDGDWTA